MRLRGLNAQASLGKKKLAKIAEALREIPDLAHFADQYYSARFEPNEGEKFFATGPTFVDGADRILVASSSLFWNVGAWEDLILFRDDELLFRCLSHEHDAWVFGERDWLRRVGGAEPEPVIRHNWDIHGVPIDPEAATALAAMVKRPD